MADLFLVPYVRTAWRMLMQRLTGGKRMCVYGAGAHTRWLLSIVGDLPSQGIECIIDDNPRIDRIEGIPVRRPEAVTIDAVAMVLISSDCWEEQLAQRCRALWGDRVDVVRLYESLPRGPYDKTDDRMEAVRLCGSRRGDDAGRRNEVVIVSDEPRSREAKIGQALKHVGWRPVLLYRSQPTFDAARYFDEAVRYQNEWEALRLASGRSPVAYHVMVNSDYRVAEVFVRHRPGIVIVDSYDLVAGMYTDAFLAEHPDFASRIKPERFCLESADGVCCRSDEAAGLRDTHGYDYRSLLFFPDGCRNSRAPDIRPPQRDDLRIVYAGKVHLAEESEGNHGRARFAACGLNAAISRALADQGLEVHVYPSPGQPDVHRDAAFAPYRKIGEQTGRLHLHAPVGADELTAVLTQFDLGLSVYPEWICPTGAAWSVTEAKRRRCTSNKFFDFLDAGLPIIHNVPPGSHLRRLLDRFGVGIDVGDWPIAEWGRRLRAIDIEAPRSRAVQAREQLDVRQHVGRLVRFYVRLRTRADRCSAASKHLLEAPGVNDRERISSEPTHANSRTDRRPAIV